MARSGGSGIGGLIGIGIIGGIGYWLWNKMNSGGTVAVSAGSAASGNAPIIPTSPTGTPLVLVNEPLPFVEDPGNVTVSAGGNTEPITNTNVATPVSNHEKVLYWLNDNPHIIDSPTWSFDVWNYMVSQIVGIPGPSPESIGWDRNNILQAAQLTKALSWNEYYAMVGAWWN